MKMFAPSASSSPQKQIKDVSEATFFIKQPLSPIKEEEPLAGSIFPGLKSKVKSVENKLHPSNDGNDGTGSSKLSSGAQVADVNEKGVIGERIKKDDSDFDHVERGGSVLQDVRQNRSKAPKRRPPTSAGPLVGDSNNNMSMNGSHMDTSFTPIRTLCEAPIQVPSPTQPTEAAEASLVTLIQQETVCQQNFKMLKLLGEGAFGQVFLVEKKDGFDKGELYAMKVLGKSNSLKSPKTITRTKTEREVLQKIIGFQFLAQMFYAFQTPENLFLLMEFAQGGDLSTHLYRDTQFPEHEARFYIAEIIVAIEQLHLLEYVYRDLKPENILLDKLGHIVLTDFGLSKALKGGARAPSFCGTMEYMAPEIVRQSKLGDLLG